MTRLVAHTLPSHQAGCINYPAHYRVDITRCVSAVGATHIFMINTTQTFSPQTKKGRIIL